MTTMTNNDATVRNEFNAIVKQVKDGCIKRGDDCGVCHVFLDYSLQCQCGEIDLDRERMK
jgi:hypothetical protein